MQSSNFFKANILQCSDSEDYCNVQNSSDDEVKGPIKKENFQTKNVVERKSHRVFQTVKFNNLFKLAKKGLGIFQFIEEETEPPSTLTRRPNQSSRKRLSTTRLKKYVEEIDPNIVRQSIVDETMKKSRLIEQNKYINEIKEKELSDISEDPQSPIKKHGSKREKSKFASIAEDKLKKKQVKMRSLNANEESFTFGNNQDESSHNLKNQRSGTTAKLITKKK